MAFDILILKSNTFFFLSNTLDKNQIRLLVHFLSQSVANTVYEKFGYFLLGEYISKDVLSKFFTREVAPDDVGLGLSTYHSSINKEKVAEIKFHYTTTVFF